MYKIIKKDGTLLGITDKVNYIKPHLTEENIFIPATKEDAKGIAFKNIQYNLENQAFIIGAEEVIAYELDATYVLENYATWDDLAKAYEEGVQNA